MAELSWRGTDHGREGLLYADKWFKTLQVLSANEGASIGDFHGRLYADLFRELPDESWTGSRGDRSLFRDYQKNWTNLGVLEPTESTGHTIVLTAKGKALVSNSNLLGFFRDTIDFYIEEWAIGNIEILVSPYELIAHALKINNFHPMDKSDLQAQTERLAIARYAAQTGTTFNTGDTNRRRFRSYLTLLENAKAVEQERSVINIIDRIYLESLIREGIEVFNPEAEVVLHPDAIDTLPENMSEDLRERIAGTRVVRQGQQVFKRKLLTAYDEQCCITGTKEWRVLDGVHILSYLGSQTNIVVNGLLLAADIHRLFDAACIAINPDTFVVEVSSQITDSRYTTYHGAKLILPRNPINNPSKEALKRKYQEFRV